MEKKLITTINGTEIYAITENGEVYVPIKPICTAIGVDVEAQRSKIKNDTILNSVAVQNTATGSDGKQYEMDCLPLKFIYGWLFSINPEKVKQDVRGIVIEHKLKCYNALYDYFTGNMRKTIETNNAEIELLKEINSAISEEKDAKTRRRTAEDKLNRLRAERLNPQPTLF